jgi:small subunit ribosomal protein S1
MIEQEKNQTNPQDEEQKPETQAQEDVQAPAPEVQTQEAEAPAAAPDEASSPEAEEQAVAIAVEKKAPAQTRPEETEEYWQMLDEGIEYGKEEYNQMLDMYNSTMSKIEEGQVIEGKILRISDTHVVLDIGFKSEGTIQLEEFKNKEELNVGDKVEVFLESLEDEDGIIVLSKKKADFIRVWDRIRTAHENDELVEGTLVRRIKGGVVVDLLGVDAFLPGSQIALRRIPNLDELMGQTFKFKIIKINKRRRNIVISRRVILESEREEKKEKLLQELEVGQVREGVVKNITDFGAFIDLGGVDGLLHITDMSWGRISHPSELVAIGDKMQVKILDLDFENGRISLGHKQLTPYPWEKAAEKYPVSSRVRGKVVSITNYGAFVELEKGIEGLVHISEMSWTRHIRHPSKVVAIGDTVDAMVLSINPEEEKISLGIKQTESDPWQTLNQKYPVGTVIEGRVRNLTSYGAFVEIEDGIDGLVHISDMSWTKRIHHPSEMVKKGDKVKVVVLNMDVENKRISLGMKQLADNPWEQIGEKYPVGTEVDCPIVRLLEKGVVVDLGEDIEGFVPISQLGLKGTVSNPAEVYKIGDQLKLKIIENDPQNHRIVLAVRDMAEAKRYAKEQLKTAGEAAEAAEIEAAEAAAEAAAAEPAAEAQAPEAEAETEAPADEAEKLEKAQEPKRKRASKSAQAEDEKKDADTSDEETAQAEVTPEEEEKVEGAELPAKSEESESAGEKTEG